VEGIITRFPGISENIVYGVEIPGCSGRAGMVNLILEIPIKDFDLDGFYTYLSKELPPYAVPRFIRISPTTEITGTFKYKKSHLQEAGYDPSKTGKEVFALIHKKYNRITAKIFKDINCGTYSF
jgi:citronellyl-CoA synthetase